jgi:AraC-like DNA-binding protein
MDTLQVDTLQVDTLPMDTLPMDTRTDLLLEVLAGVPHVMVCVKDGDGRYVAANDAFVRRARRRRAGDVVGRCAADLFPADLAASYDAQDRVVLVTGRAIRNHLELIEDHTGARRWYLTTKVRAGGHVVVVSVEAGLGSDAARGLRAAVELAHARFADGVRVADLAEAAGTSSDRLERSMRRVLGVSPKQYVLRLRAEYAARLLVTTELPIAAIAAECGYYDQSQLTRQFRDHIGMTPRGYRGASFDGRTHDATPE